MSQATTSNIFVVGGGAAGYFAAIRAAECNPQAAITITEAGKRPLQKLSVSGGGRCNVTQACFDAGTLTASYPRGSRELLGPFHRFQPKDTVAWFKKRGVELKTESDGRMFPVTDSSATIIDCFEKARLDANIELRLNTRVKSIRKTAEGQFAVGFAKSSDAPDTKCAAVILATGGVIAGRDLASSLGHQITECVPSLFTFEIEDQRLTDLSGLSVPDALLQLNVENESFKQSGPLLVTHWGLSGPGVIRLSAWAAKPLAHADYQAELIVDWCPLITGAELKQAFSEMRTSHPRKSVCGKPVIDVPKRLWASICSCLGVQQSANFAELPGKLARGIENELKQGKYKVSGKGVFKEEFVTCGGVRLSEVDFRSMESKLVPGLHFAGEILDIDGVTGGYNFQSAWTTGFVAGSAVGGSDTAALEPSIS